MTDLGAENIVVPNLPSLGSLPFSQEFQDEATALTIAYNGGLSLALDNLNSEYSETEAVEVDIFTANENIFANPEQFGLSNVTDPFLLSGLEPAETTGFFFWDDFHPTTEVHALFGDTIEQTIDGELQPTFNNVIGTEEPDSILGTETEDNIDGLAGDDLISGGEGEDRLEGWSGQDSLFGGQGDDIIDGGEDDDTIDGGEGDDLLFGSQGNNTILGNSGKDILVGGSDADSLLGGSDADYLLGGAGEDLLLGKVGNDTLNGGDGNDLFLGGNGDDLIDGGAGSDTLFGNDGADIFELTPNFGTDRIEDFQASSDYASQHSEGAKSFQDAGASRRYPSDRLMLSGGLSFGDLSFNNSNISLAATDETLATLSGIDTSTLTESDFIFAEVNS